MTHAIDTVFIDAILVPLMRELGLPETLPLAKLSPRMQKWALGEAACLQPDAMSHSTFALLVEYGDPLTRESYLNINNVGEDDVDAEQESELPHLFQESMIGERVASVMFEIEIDDTLRQLSQGARRRRTLLSSLPSHSVSRQYARKLGRLGAEANCFSVVAIKGKLPPSRKRRQMKSGI